MEKYEIQKLRDLPIEGVAEQLGMVVKRHKALCPFHADHHASLSFNTRRNSCRCYVCMGDSVGTIDLVMKYLGKDFLSACRWLAEVNGVYLEDSHSKVVSSSSPASLSSSSSETSSETSSEDSSETSSKASPKASLSPPSMPGSMRDSLSIPGSTGRLGDFFSRKEGLMREWRDGAD